MKPALIIPLLFASYLATGQVTGQSTHKLLRQADQSYRADDYSQAELQYRKSLSKEEDPSTTYNLGNAIFRQERYDEAAKKFDQAARNLSNDEDKAKALYNLGVSQYLQEQFPESIESLVRSLQLQPEDPEAKAQLLKVLRQMQEQQQQQQQDQASQDQDQQSQDQQSQPSPSPPQDSEDAPQQQSPASSGDTQQEDQNPQEDSQSESKQMSREEALDLLKAVEKQEEDVQNRQKLEGKRKRSKKDW